MSILAPVTTGFVERDGVRTRYRVYGEGTTTIVLLPTWSIVHARTWKAQVPYLARHYRVVTIDGRGNGDSDRPESAGAYRPPEFIADILAVMDEIGIGTAIIVGFSFGGHLAALLAARHPERVSGAILIAPTAPFGPNNPSRNPASFLADQADHEGWGKFNKHYWLENYENFLSFFFGRIFPEPHSTKQIEDGVSWGAQTSPEVLIDTIMGRFESAHEEGEEVYRRIACPVIVIHGEEDDVVPYAKGRCVAELLGAPLLTIERSGHSPHARDPALINAIIRDFVNRVAPGPPTGAPTRIPRGLGRGKRALYLSSPIGLGHARRDLAIARELRGLHPDLEIDWLTQDPVTTLLGNAGERVHPASRHLLNESRHIESEAGEHQLHVFQSLRTMDEILIANFMLFQEVLEDERYDLVIGDEAWDVDHFWHEHPELKRGAFAWLTDFVGYLPMPERGAREAALTADYNAEMIEHIARYPRIRDRSIFVGEPEDIVPDTFGPGLPGIREWTEQHFQFCGYVLADDAPAAEDRGRLRPAFGFKPDEKICVVAVGGSGVGGHLLQRAIEAFPMARAMTPELRMIVIAGPRIDPRTLPVVDGVEIRGFVADLPNLFAACDVALVQGGLTTAMELAAVGTPFVYIPLRDHFEQQFHVAHRLQRYRAGRRLEFDEANPERIASELSKALAGGVAPLPVERDGAARAARMIAELI
ncbi:MAG TPA: alpha/beta fold hydrolase [Saliniramus sp.]|nr:alpha/beta fold hydrolase [Saliniramus sp.]